MEFYADRWPSAVASLFILSIDIWMLIESRGNIGLLFCVAMGLIPLVIYLKIFLLSKIPLLMIDDIGMKFRAPAGKEYTKINWIDASSMKFKQSIASTNKFYYIEISMKSGESITVNVSNISCERDYLLNTIRTYCPFIFF